MKRVFCALLTAALLLTAFAATSAQASGLSSVFEGGRKEEPASPDAYVFGADELASIPAIVGQREWVSPQPGDDAHQYAYLSGSVRDDLLAYIDYLGELGFEVMRGASLSEPGDGELVAASKDAGQQLHVALSWEQDGYSIRLSKSGEKNARPVPAVTEQPVAKQSASQPEQTGTYESFLSYCDVYGVTLNSDARQSQIVPSDGGDSVEYHPLDGVTFTYYYDAEGLSSTALWIDATIESAYLVSSELLIAFVTANDPAIDSVSDMIASMITSTAEVSEGLNFATVESGAYSYSLLLIPSESQLGMYIAPLN